MVVCLLGAPLATVPASAQGRAGAPPSRSTLSGVYSAEQAARGREVYAGMCQSCHTPASHTGVAFRTNWNGRRLSELFGFVRERMPKNEPGSLSAEEYVDVLSYLLKLNQMPAGASELPPDSTALRTIRIDTVVTARHSSAPR